MNAKQHLSELQTIKIKIGQLQEQRQMYLDMATSITAPINQIKVQTSRMPDRLGNHVLKAADIEMKIDKEVNSLFFKQQEIIKKIQSLCNADYMQVLFKVYVQDKTIKQASQEMGRSYNFVLDAHKKALAEFDKKYYSFLHGKKAESTI